MSGRPWWHLFVFVRPARGQEEAGEHVDALIEAAHAAGFVSEGGFSTCDEAALASYGTEQIRDALAEAVWEVEREPRTSLWASFWDRLTNGDPAPAMPEKWEAAER